MHKTAIGLAILLFLVIAGLVVGPHFANLDRFRTPLAANLSARFGREVALDGPITLALLPRPTIVLRNLRIANPPGAAVPDMLRLRAAEVKPALWPLLKGEIDLRSATLVAPDLDIERLPDGMGNWQGLPVAGAPPGQTASSPPGFAIAIDHLAVEDGAVTYRTPGGLERFEHITGQASFEGPAGPISAAADLVARGAAFHVEAASGAWGAADVPLQLQITANPAARLRLDLTLSGGGENRQLTGKLSFATEDLRAIAATLLRATLPATLARPLSLGAQLGGTAGGPVLDHLMVDFGSAHGEGSLRLARGKHLGVALSLAVRRLDLDRWLATPGAGAAPAPGLTSAFAAEVPPSRAPPDAGSSAPAWLDGVDATFDLTADAVLWHRGLMRDLRLIAELSPEAAKVERLAALLPGGSTLALSGAAQRTPDGWHGEGRLEARADDLRGLLSWSGVRLDGVAPGRLGKAMLATRLSLAGERLGLDGIDASVDATRIKGAAQMLLRKRPLLALQLSADQINLDAYLPHGALADAAPGASGIATDLDMDAHIGTLTWEGQPLRDVHVAGAWQNGTTQIRDLSIAEIAGAAAKLSGSIAGSATDIPQGQLSLEIHGPEFERVLRLAVPDLAPGHSYGDFRLSGALTSDGTRLSLAGTLAILDGQLHVTGDVLPAAEKADVTFEISHPRVAELIGAFSPGYRPAGGDLGALALSGHVAGSPAQFTFDRLSLSLGPHTLSGSIAVDLSAGRPRLNADLAIGDWAVDELLPLRQTAGLAAARHFAQLRPGLILAAAAAPEIALPRWSPAPLDFAALSLADVDLHLTGGSLAYGPWRLGAPDITAGLGQGVLTLQHLAGTLFGGNLTAAGQLDGTASALRGEFRLSGAKLGETLAPLGLSALDGRYDLSGKLSTAGASPAQMIAGLSGEMRLTGGDATILGLNLNVLADALKAQGGEPDILELMRAGTSGRTAVSAFSGTIALAQGIARSDDLTMTAEGGEGRASLALNLPNWTITGRAEFSIAGMADAPPLAVRFEGPIGESHAVFEVAALERFLDARASVPRR